MPYDELLRREEVEQLCKISRSALYRLMRLEKFPEPLKIGPRSVRWIRGEVEDWVASRPRSRGDGPTTTT